MCVEKPRRVPCLEPAPAARSAAPRWLGPLSHKTAGRLRQAVELQALESTRNGKFFVLSVSAGVARGLTSHLYAQVSIRKNERSPEVHLEK